MGVIQPDFWLYEYYVNNYAAKNNKLLRDFSMLELGNQTFQDESLIVKVNLPRTVKEYWESKELKHVSIDLNGEDGALALDLSIPLPERFYIAFDIVTNGGTSEHVDNQFECWRNIHKCLKLNGFLLSASPEKYEYNEDHCDWFCDVNFFEVFAQRLGYRIYLLGRVLFPYNGGYSFSQLWRKQKTRNLILPKTRLILCYFIEKQMLRINNQKQEIYFECKIIFSPTN